MFTCSRVMLAVVVVVVITQTGTGQDRTGQDDSLTLPASRGVVITPGSYSISYVKIPV
jgi:hypothetical protein